MYADLNQFKHILIVDLEATCCDQESFPRQEMETIEIGAVIVETSSLEIIDEYTIFIKPVRNPILTDFCRTLTSITQQDVDDAITYPEAVIQFNGWLSKYDNFVFCSWGNYDKSQLDKDSQFHKIPFPIEAPHVNLKNLFSTSLNLKKRYGLSSALGLARMEFLGTHHRGIDDAKNMARLMPYILGKKTLSIPKSALLE